MLLSPEIETCDLTFLDAKFAKKLEELVATCGREKINLHMGATTRGPAAQGRMWCRSRSIAEVLGRREILEQANSSMSRFLRPEWAGLGPTQTWHLPGQSWHQWGVAADVAVVLGGKLTWEGSTMEIVAKFAARLDLFHSYFRGVWNPNGRRWHIQLHKEESPLMIRGFCDSWVDVDREMAARFEL